MERHRGILGGGVVLALVAGCALSEPRPEGPLYAGQVTCAEGWIQDGSTCVARTWAIDPDEVGFQYCAAGYERVEQECLPITVPENANLVGDGWQCRNGYTLIENECVFVPVPENAYLEGRTLSCEEGYVAYDRECRELSTHIGYLGSFLKDGQPPNLVSAPRYLGVLRKFSSREEFERLRAYHPLVYFQSSKYQTAAVRSPAVAYYTELGKARVPAER